MHDSYKVNGYKFSFSTVSDQEQICSTPKFLSKQFVKGTLVNNKNNSKLNTFCCPYDKENYLDKLNLKKKIQIKKMIPLSQYPIQNQINLISLQQPVPSQKVKSKNKLRKIQLSDQNYNNFFNNKAKTQPIQQQKSLVQLWNLNQNQNSKFHTHRFYKSSKTLSARCLSQFNKNRSGKIQRSNSQSTHSNSQSTQVKHKILINPKYLLQNYKLDKLKSSNIHILKQASNKQLNLIMQKSMKITKRKQQNKKIVKKMKIGKENQSLNLKNKKIEQMIKYNMANDFIYIQT